MATVTSDAFVPGTFVTVGSFLLRHPWFKGDVLVLHHGLSEAGRETLAAFPQVQLRAVSPDLANRVAQLGEALPQFRRPVNRLPRFYSLEAFRLDGYRKVLFCDSDVLFNAPVDELFSRAEPLLCAGDQPCIRGYGRDCDTFGWVPANAPNAYLRTFNAGFLLIDRALTAGPCHADLLAMIRPQTWRNVPDVGAVTDQLLLNQYFAGRQTLIEPTYNYLMSPSAFLKRWHGLELKNAKVLHFNGIAKPWQMDNVLRHAQGEAGRRPVSGYSLWYEAWMECIETAHLRAAFKGWVAGALS